MKKILIVLTCLLLPSALIASDDLGEINLTKEQSADINRILAEADQDSPTAQAHYIPQQSIASAPPGDAVSNTKPKLTPFAGLPREVINFVNKSKLGTTYECCECHRNYRDKNFMIDHALAQHFSLKWICNDSDCNKSLATWRTMHQHLISKGHTKFGTTAKSIKIKAKTKTQPVSTDTTIARQQKTTDQSNDLFGGLAIIAADVVQSLSHLPPRSGGKSTCYNVPASEANNKIEQLMQEAVPMGAIASGPGFRATFSCPEGCKGIQSKGNLRQHIERLHLNILSDSTMAGAGAGAGSSHPALNNEDNDGDQPMPAARAGAGAGTKRPRTLGMPTADTSAERPAKLRRLDKKSDAASVATAAQPQEEE